LGVAYGNKKMPLITSCPECNTQFIVKKEQLKAYDGKVRCGTCNHVFNANEYLVKPEKPKKVPAKTTKTTKTTTPAESEDTTEHIEINSPSFLENAFPEASASDSQINQQTEVESPSVVQDLSIDTKFNKKKKTKFNWLLFTLCIALFLGLLAQLTYFLRTEISANYPQTKPWLAIACQHIGCTVSLPTKIDLLTIDDSDMQEHVEYENVLQFTSTLVNHANFAQAYPNIELTLTNTDDEPVLRRRFNASDYLSNQVNQKDGMAPKEEVRIKLNINTADVAVAGYRVSLTY
jgi:predicted Zn finger-like uncharacterized protein